MSVVSVQGSQQICVHSRHVRRGGRLHCEPGRHVGSLGQVHIPCASVLMQWQMRSIRQLTSLAPCECRQINRVRINRECARQGGGLRSEPGRHVRPLGQGCLPSAPPLPQWPGALQRSQGCCTAPGCPGEVHGLQGAATHAGCAPYSNACIAVALVSVSDWAATHSSRSLRCHTMPYTVNLCCLCGDDSTNLICVKSYHGRCSACCERLNGVKVEDTLDHGP